MNKKKLLVALLTGGMAMSTVFGVTACGNSSDGHEHDYGTDWSTNSTHHWHECKNEGCDAKEKDKAVHVDADKNGECDVCKYAMSAAEYTEPVITVDPEEMTVYESDEIAFLFGVTVTDEYDAELRVTVSDDGGLYEEGGNVAGRYTVTYSATNSKGKTGTATRTYIVEEDLPNIVFEVQKENDAANWVNELGNEAGKMVFGNNEFITITEENKEETTFYQYAQNGIWYNATGDTVVLTVTGSHGEAAILNAAGVMIEGRDGANGKLVNKENPQRVTSTATSFIYNEEAYAVAQNFASYMQIPAGGYAIVVANVGDGNFNTDGRGWLNKNLVYQYGTAVKIYNEGEESDPFTQYVDQSPVVLTNPELNFRVGQTVENIAELLVQGIAYVDDNGTWDVSDDVKTGLSIELVSDVSDFSTASAGATFTYTVKLTDGQGNFTEIERKVTITDATPTGKTIVINDTWYEFGDDKIVVNPVSGATSYDAIVYTSYFTGNYFVNNFGFYMIVGTDGKVKETYHPANNKIYNAENPEGVSASQTDVLSQVTLSAGEYVVLAVNGASGTFRASMNSLCSKANDYMIGMDVELANIDYLPKITATINGTVKTLTGKGSILINQAATTANVAKQSFLIYTKSYQGEIVCNGYGVAIVIDEATGNLLKIYDGANAKYYDYETYTDGKMDDNNRVPAAQKGFNSSNFASVAFTQLADGEILIVLPNDGVNGADSPRTFGMGLRENFKDYVIGFVNFSVPDVAEESNSAEFTVTKSDNSKLTYTAETYLFNAAAESTDAAKEVSLLVYDKSFTGTIVCDQKTIAVIIDSNGKIARIYDGANGNLHEYVNEAEVKTSYQDAERGWTREETAQTAFASLQDGETLVVFVRNDTLGDNSPHKWANTNLRSANGSIEWWTFNVTLEGNFNEA